MTPAELAALEARIPSYSVGAQADMIDLLTALRASQADCAEKSTGLLESASHIRRFASEVETMAKVRHLELKQLRAALERIAITVDERTALQGGDPSLAVIRHMARTALTTEPNQGADDEREARRARHMKAAMAHERAEGAREFRERIVAWLRDTEGEGGTANALLLRVADTIERLP